MRRVCETCRFWQHEPDPTVTQVVGQGTPTGYCRRFPVSVNTRADHWCGEHQGKPGRKANGDSK